ncbi:hypothetical protein AB7M49_005923 [Bradyrhizobium elkanii]
MKAESRDYQNLTSSTAARGAPLKLQDSIPKARSKVLFSKISRISSSTRVTAGSTVFALAASGLLYLIPQQPPDPRIRQTFRLWQGHAYVVLVKYPISKIASARLYEDDYPLGPANSDPQDISWKGNGLYRIYLQPDETVPTLMFSTSDNTDPNNNGRKYRLE